MSENVTLDVEAILNTSRAFYESHQLADWAAGLPQAVSLSDSDQTQFQEAQGHGLTAAFAFPSPGV